MHVEAAGVTERGFRFGSIPLLCVKFSEGERGVDVPPMFSRELLYRWQGRARPMTFAEQFGFEADQRPDAGIILPCFRQDLEGAGGVLRLNAHPGDVERRDPGAAKLLARFR